jgi:polyisoprenoid-binding protein YceI
MSLQAKSTGAEPVIQEMNANTCYAIDRAGSEFTVQVFASGLLSAFGHSPKIAIRDFSGVAQVNPDDIAHSSLKIIIRADSLAVRDDVSDKDRREIERVMQQDVLEAAAYPEIVYGCSNITATKNGQGQYSVTLNGDLTMHGITHSQTVTARAAITEDSLRAFGNFSLRQTDYDLKLVTIAGGALKVKDELKFSFNILARKKE